MRLKNLQIYREEYGTSKGKLNAKISYESEKGVIEIIMTDEQIKGVLAVVADALVVATKEVAEVLTRDVLEHALGKPQLEKLT